MTTNQLQPIDLSPTQRIVWHGQKMHPDLPIYNTAYAFRFLDTLNLNAFSLAHEKLVESTDSLRIILLEDGDAPKQKVRNSSTGKLRLCNCRTLSDNAFKELLSTETCINLDLGVCSWQSTLFERENGTHVWHFLQHHLLIDGIGYQILLHRMGELYRKELGLEPPHNNSGSPSFANWVKTHLFDYNSKSHSVTESDRANYSRLYSSKSPAGAPFGERYSTRIGSKMEADLSKLTTHSSFASFSPELSLNLVLLTSVFALLFRIEQRSSICIGVANHGRTSNEEKKTVGLFVNITPISVTIDKLDTFTQLHEKVRIAFFSQNALKTAPNQNQQYDVTFSFLGGEMSTFGDLSVDSEWLYPKCHESANRWRIHYITTGNEPEFTFDFNDEAFSPETKGVAMRNLLATVSAFTHSSEQRINSYPLVDPYGQDASALVSSESKASVNANLWDCFYSIARQFDSSIAVKSGKDQWTYHELRVLAEQLSESRLVGSISVNDLVPIIGQRSPATLLAILAAMRAGGAFLPVDSSLPQVRVESIIADSKARVILDSRNPFPQNELSEIRESRNSDTAYVIYTSGSTGIPNGVAVGHCSVINLLQDMEERAPLPDGSNCMWWTAIGFDVSIYEIFSAVLYGHTLHIPSEEIRMNATALFEWMDTNNINSAYLPPFMLSALNSWLDTNTNFQLKRLLVGVEPIQENLLVSIARKVDGLKIVNGYGPTETTVCATFYSVDTNLNETGRTPIGKPITGNKCYILDRHLNMMPRGIVGELYISGTGLARGYWQRPQLDKERFIDNPFTTKKDDARIYKTGDLARLSDNGQLEFIGRADSQIKLRGQRIDPREIEQTMTELADISQCVARTARIGEQDELVCYYTSFIPIDSAKLFEHAAQRLPFQFLPKRFQHLDAFPTTTNGKINFENLPKPEANAHNTGTRKITNPSGPVAERVAEIWSEKLNISAISANQSFFELGGSSLAAMETVLKLCNEFDIDLPPQTIFRHSTVQRLADAIEEAILKSIETMSDDEASQMLHDNE